MGQDLTGSSRTAISATEKNGPIHIKEDPQSEFGGAWDSQSKQIEVGTDGVDSPTIKQATAFEMFNASSSDRFAALDEKAEKKGFEENGVKPVKAAEDYAAATEKVEFDNTEGTEKVMSELGLQDKVEHFPSTFDESFKRSTESGHALSYVEDYGTLTGRDKSFLSDHSSLNPANANFPKPLLEFWASQDPPDSGK